MVVDDRAEKILAHSLHRELQHQGYSAKLILELASELLELATAALHDHAAEKSSDIEDVENGWAPPSSRTVH